MVTERIDRQKIMINKVFSLILYKELHIKQLPNREFWKYTWTIYHDIP